MIFQRETLRVSVEPTSYIGVKTPDTKLPRECLRLDGMITGCTGVAVGCAGSCMLGDGAAETEGETLGPVFKWFHTPCYCAWMSVISIDSYCYVYWAFNRL